MPPHGIEVRNLTKKNPGNNLPEWVKAAAVARGYGDSKHPLSLYVTADDIQRAVMERAQGNGRACAMAQAGTRLGTRFIYFYRTTAWVDFGAGPVVRYQVSNDIYNHIIKPFDDGDKAKIRPGIYHLLAPKDGRSLARRRETEARRGNTSQTRPNGSKPRPYMGRVVMATQEQAS